MSDSQLKEIIRFITEAHKENRVMGFDEEHQWSWKPTVYGSLESDKDKPTYTIIHIKVKNK